MPGAKSSVAVDCEQQKREWENSLVKLAGLLLSVSTGWSAALQHSLSPTLLPGSQLELRSTWRPMEGL